MVVLPRPSHDAEAAGKDLGRNWIGLPRVKLTLNKKTKKKKLDIPCSQIILRALRE